MKILKVGSKSFEDDDLYHIHWDVTRNCNFQCEYCVTHKDEPILPLYQVNKILDFFRYINYVHYKDIILSIFGGEPTLHPDFFGIINNIGGVKDIQIQTNFHKELDWWKELSKINSNLIIIPSYHHNKIDDVEFVEKVIALLDHFKFIKVKVMWESDYKTDIINIYEKLKFLLEETNNASVSLDMVYHETQNFSKDDFNYYLAQQSDKLFYIEHEDRNKIIKKDLSYNEVKAFHGGDVNFYMYRCYSGCKGIFVNYKGDVYHCQSMRNYERDPLFNLFDDFKPIDEHIKRHIICPINQTCYEIVIPKESII